METALEGINEFLQGTLGVNFSLGYNTLIILFVIFVAVLIGFSLGRSRMILALVSLYIAAVIDSRFIYFNELQRAVGDSGLEIRGYVLRIGLFLLVYAIVMLILYKTALGDAWDLDYASPISIVILAFLGIGFLASILVGYIPADSSIAIPQNTVRYFGSDTAKFVWALLPVVGILLIKERD